MLPAATESRSDSALPLSALAKLDPSVVLLDGLFKSLKDTSAQRRYIELTREFSGGKTIARYTGPQLGVDDLRAFQALLAIGSMGAKLANPKSKVPVQPVIVECSYRYLAISAGYAAADSGKVVTGLEACLARLSQGMLFKGERTDDAALGEPLVTSLLPETAPQGRRRGLRVQFHPQLTKAIRAGLKGTQFLQLDMNEVRVLKGRATRLIHHRLCHADPGEEVAHSLDKLLSYVGGVTAPSLTRHQKRHDVTRVAEAITELRGLGWKFTEDGVTQWGSPKYLILRPQRQFSNVETAEANLR